MYFEPWYDIEEYPADHRQALEVELSKEIYKSHILHGLNSSVIAKREDRDDILVQNESGYFVVHLSWTGKPETDPFPITKQYKTLVLLQAQLKLDADEFE